MNNQEIKELVGSSFKKIGDGPSLLYRFCLGNSLSYNQGWILLEAEIEGSADKFALFGLGGAAAVLPVPFPVGLLSERAEDEVAEHLEKVAKQARDQKQNKKPAKACASDELLASLPSPCLASLLLSSFPKVERLSQGKPRSPGDL